MEIKELKIVTNRIDEQENFYGKILGFNCRRLSESILIVQTKENKLIFELSNNPIYYHFSFLIPTDSLESAIEYIKSKSIKLLQYLDEDIIHFKSGRSLYFYDSDNNIVELIERPSLDYPKSSSFSIYDVIKLNEIGLPVEEPQLMANNLIENYGIVPLNSSDFQDNFCWVGDYNGVIIVVKEGRNWLPTQKPGIVNDFAIRYTDNGKEYSIRFEKNRIRKWL